MKCKIVLDGIELEANIEETELIKKLLITKFEELKEEVKDMSTPQESISTKEINIFYTEKLHAQGNTITLSKIPVPVVNKNEIDVYFRLASEETSNATSGIAIGNKVIVPIPDVDYYVMYCYKEDFAKLLTTNAQSAPLFKGNNDITITQKSIHTGYERAEPGDYYYFYDSHGGALEEQETNDEFDIAEYDHGNYYTNKELAERNAKAERLLRQLRRFSVKYRKNELDFNNHDQIKYYIFYNYIEGSLDYDHADSKRCFGQIYFDTMELAQFAIDTFYDELMWYFTEYKDNL